jgi:hypothetical protein
VKLVVWDRALAAAWPFHSHLKLPKERTQPQQVVVFDGAADAAPEDEETRPAAPVDEKMEEIQEVNLPGSTPPLVVYVRVG